MIFILCFFACFVFTLAEIPRFEDYEADFKFAHKCKYSCFAGIDDFDIDSVIYDDEGRVVYKFTDFPVIEEIFGYMNYLQSKYADRVFVFDIGVTDENLPLKVIRIGPQYLYNSTVWLDGGIHAREWISISSMGFIMYILAEQWHKLSPAMQKTEFFLLPVMNPDGYRYTYTKDRLWRKNRRFTGKCYGVDLNRNFPYKWGHTHYLIKDGTFQQKRPCNEIYEGPAVLSEVESAAVVYFILSSGRKFQAFLTFHSYGRKINYPYGYEPRVPKDASLLNYVATKAKYIISNATGVNYDVTPLSMTDYVSPGNSIDWAYHNNITFSYLIELSRDTFLVPTSDILPTGKEAFVILQTVVENLYTTRDEINSVSFLDDIFSEVVQE